MKNAILLFLLILVPNLAQGIDTSGSFGKVREWLSPEEWRKDFRALLKKQNPQITESEIDYAEKVNRFIGNFFKMEGLLNPLPLEGKEITWWENSDIATLKKGLDYATNSTTLLFPNYVDFNDTEWVLLKPFSFKLPEEETHPYCKFFQSHFTKKSSWLNSLKSDGLFILRVFTGGLMGSKFTIEKKTAYKLEDMKFVHLLFKRDSTWPVKWQALCHFPDEKFGFKTVKDIKSHDLLNVFNDYIFFESI